jgi:diacylglycerol kinase family enzyme
MKFAQVVHNPGAGEGAVTKKELIALINSAGFGCSYSSTKKKGWEKFESLENDFIILAGGDGTVRKVAGELLDKTLLDKKLPIGLLPMGTANNIARTLGIRGEHRDIIKSWTDNHVKKFDVARVFGLGKSRFFLESFGYGIFPRLMAEMKKQADADRDTPEKSLRMALSILHDLIEEMEPRYCRIALDGTHHDGNYILVEVMNTSSIGPNLKLAPLADPGDGVFEIVLIGDSQRQEFAEYIKNKLQGREIPFAFTTLKAKTLEIFWDGSDAHIDDQYVELEKNSDIRIELLHGLLEFFVPEPILASA